MAAERKTAIWYTLWGKHSLVKSQLNAIQFWSLTLHQTTGNELTSHFQPGRSAHADLAVFEPNLRTAHSTSRYFVYITITLGLYTGLSKGCVCEQAQTAWSSSVNQRVERSSSILSTTTQNGGEVNSMYFLQPPKCFFSAVCELLILPCPSNVSAGVKGGNKSPQNKMPTNQQLASRSQGTCQHWFYSHEQTFVQEQSIMNKRRRKNCS